MKLRSLNLHPIIFYPRNIKPSRTFKSLHLTIRIDYEICLKLDFKKPEDYSPQPVGLGNTLRATSHTRLRARDHYTSSTLIGGKGGATPSSLQHYA